MRPILFPALFLALPSVAQAQFVAGPGPAPEPMPGIVDRGTLPTMPSLGHQLGEARDRIEGGRKRGELTKREARGLRRDAGMIETLADRYGADGLSDSERRELDMRTEVLRTLTAAQRLQGAARRP
ncbi:hypothetical protein [Sphingopyxis sp. GW247-27LB]|uniref:hypothetical protein n=1 Tax=Sphingopyxis sp. GW247-27LB TaxID=2012632 RepID=UPI000BA5923B|nr:hypothetical protein [Sphingopyxis sp. GW247-27LB]PAL24548.1 hypothetical protein CD928_03895 [Sphingopyxis sp. GW247-27LB]